MEKIKEVCELQKKIYVLQELNRRKGEIFSKIEDSVPKPVAPREIQYSYKEIPDYDEEKYVKLAKAQGSGLGEFRDNAIFVGLSLASTVIGLLIFWIPLLLAFLSWPYSIYHTRKMAYKLYIEDCKKLENQNECNKIEIEQFNRASAKYQNDLQLYQTYQNNAKVRTKAYEIEFQKAANELANLNNKYILLCDELDIPSSCRDFASINMILSYIHSGKAFSVLEAVKQFQFEANAGRISTNIEYIKRNYSVYQNTMPDVVRSLKECNYCVEFIERDLIESIKAVTNECENIKNTQLSKYISNESI